MNSVKSFIELSESTPLKDFMNQPFDVSMLVNPIDRSVMQICGAKGIKLNNENEYIYENDLQWQQAEQKRLFEGWEFESETYFYNGDEIKVFPDTTLSITEIEYDLNIKPKTLNDFITLCKLAGIELTWNPNNQKVKELGL